MKTNPEKNYENADMINIYVWLHTQIQTFGLHLFCMKHGKFVYIKAYLSTSIWYIWKNIWSTVDTIVVVAARCLTNALTGFYIIVL